MDTQGTIESLTGMEIAIIGMTGRFPGARNLEQFRRNLGQGVESISFFSRDELLRSGVAEEESKDPHYVPAAGVIEGEELFDAEFFGFYPREAEILDPQQRLFLEASWEALELAGYDPATYAGSIGVYAGAGMNHYLLENLLRNRRILASVQPYQLVLGSDKDFLPTRVSYKLNLRGPSVNIQTACSTSLVAVHFACQGLLNYQCDLALAGGVSITVPQRRGYLYQEGGIASPDGHCRAFDARAKGTVGGNGLGIVVLKRLAEAIEDGDHIHAVIKGSAINNDGSQKVGFTAPSVEGQAEAIAMALAVAGVSPETISYIEAHGTGTSLGDPIEISALTQVFRQGTKAKGFCAIGSVKSNIGHLNAAAGVTGLIKTAIALEEKEIPPSINYERANPAIDFAESPFYVNDRLRDWDAGDRPRRAGVSSFGIGGTNAHVVLEEAPARESTVSARSAHLLVLSAKSPAALNAATSNLAEHLKRNPTLNPADVAYTCQVGRQAMAHRRALVYRDLEDAVAVLESRDPARLAAAVPMEEAPQTVFLFSGQGSQYVEMGRELYRSAPVFREQVDRCAELLSPRLGVDLRAVLYPAKEGIEESARQLTQTRLTQPALFVIEYALARLWESWGIHPTAMIGHSLGEYVAACLAGVFTLEEGLRLVALRGHLMQGMPVGAMLSVPLAENEIRPMLDRSLALAAVNSARSCVISGPVEAIEQFERLLAGRGIEGRRLHTSHAFHSAMMDPIVETFRREVARTPLQAPTMPFISNVTGAWITDEEATDPGYWASHLRQGVRFADGVGVLLENPHALLLEVGPGHVLSSLAKLHPACNRERVVVSSMRHPQDPQTDWSCLLQSVGKLWLAGARIDWPAFHAPEKRLRLPLPTYPFERRRYWVEPQDKSLLAGGADLHLVKRTKIDEWFYQPSWKRNDLSPLPDAPRSWLVLADDFAIGHGIVDCLGRRGIEPILVRPGKEFRRQGDALFTIDPHRPEDYQALLSDLAESGRLPDSIVHVWNSWDRMPGPASTMPGPALKSLFWLAKALARSGQSRPIRLEVLTCGIFEVIGDEYPDPGEAPILGLCKVIPQELPFCEVRHLDLAWSEAEGGTADWSIERAVDEMLSLPVDLTVAFRGRHRWTQTFEPFSMPAGDDRPPGLPERGVCLITGGLGRIALVFAEYLARTVKARLALIERQSFPARENWTEWLETHDEDDAASRKIRRLLGMEEMGAEILILTADVGDREEVDAAIERVERRFGPIDGVIHAAGLVGDEIIKPLENAALDDFVQQFRPKVNGAVALGEALQGRRLRFCLLQSSLSTVLGGWGYGAYAAANHFLDHYAQRQRRAGLPWISVNWDGWKFEELAVAAPGTALALAMTPEEGIEAFQRILSMSGLAQVAVSTADLSARMRKPTIREGEGKTEKPEPEDRGSHYPRPNLTESLVEPRDEYERRIVEIWQEVLGIDRIGVNDNFFELGGHSLLATQVVSRLRDLYRMEFPLRRLFEMPTVARLAELVREGQGGAVTSLSPEGEQVAAGAIVPVPRTGDLPLSYAQQRLWFLDQLEPGSPLYNNPAAIRLRGRVNIEAFTESLNLVVARHEVLRTVFAGQGGRPIQQILPSMPVTVPIVDLSGLPEEKREAEMRRLAAEEAIHSFDLSQGPLLRMTLMREAEDSHVALLTMHHIASDGWSVGVLIGELAEAYRAIARGQSPQLPFLPIQYADFAKWQREWLEKGARDEQIAYWKRRLPNPSLVLELPTDRPRPPVQTFRGATQWGTLPRSVRGELESLARGEGVTLFMVLLAAFQTLLHRYTGQTEIRIGSPVAGRRWAETEGLIGCFINPLVMCANLDGRPTFRDLLRQVRETTLEAYAHQDLPFEMLVEALQPERNLSHSPFFQVMLVLQNAPSRKLELPGLRIEELKLDRGTEKFDLTLFVEEIDDGLRLGWSYNTDLFNDETIGRMARHFNILLQAILNSPEERVSALPLLIPEERDLILNTWNQPAEKVRPFIPVTCLIRDQTERTPNDIAAICGTDRLTYAELDRRATQLALTLRGLGIEAGNIVAACLDRSLDAVVALLGIMKAGGAWLPIDPSYPPDRVEFMLRDSKAKVLLAHRRVENPDFGFDRLDMPVLRLDEDWMTADSTGDGEPLPAIDPDQLAYVIYTSGSTGQPKGVMISHRSLSEHCRVIQHHYRLNQEDRVLQFASFNFDPSLEQILPTLMTGACVVLREGDVLPAAQFNQLVADSNLTVVNIPPAYWHQWALGALEWSAGQPNGSRGLTPPSALRLVIVGGDTMLPETLGLWRQTPMKDVRLLNAYGPTETTVTALTCEVTQTMTPEMPRRIPIGQPMAGRTAYILDEDRQPVPLGVPGELYLGGLGVAQGYLNHPELTAEKFIDDPFASLPGARLYRTGDLARYLPDGNIEFLGRRDYQIKIRGFRVELEEIEAVLRRHPAVKQAAVSAVEDDVGEKRLVAYLVSASEPRSEAQDLRQWMKSQLPDYMVPAIFVELAAMPLTAGGKIDRQALPEADFSLDAARKGFVAPEGETEQQLASLWAEVLKRDRIGRNENFFDLGGHSLLATQLMSRIREAFGVELPLRGLFEAPTIEQLALSITQRRAETIDAEELERLLAELEGLPEEEVQ